MWADKSSFYHIYPLGFCGSPQQNDFTSTPASCLFKIYDWIPHLKKMGINAVYFGPVFESGTHGYDTKDYFKIDRRLGDNQDFKALVTKLHQAGIKVVLDAVFNHVGRDFFAFKDLQLPDSLEYWSSLIYCVLCKSSNQYDVSFASFNAICNFETKSDLPWAYLASLIFAPMLVPLLPIWLEIILSCCAFNCLTKPMICTAKSNDCSASLSVAMLNLLFANILTQFDDLSMKHCVATQNIRFALMKPWLATMMRSLK